MPNLYSQVNTEKFRKFSDKEGFLFNSGFRFGYSGGNSEYVTVDGTFRLDYNGKKNDAFIVANYDYKESSATKVTNNGFLHLRGIHTMSEKMVMEAFLQQEFNEFLLLADRKLAGAGARMRVMDFTSNKDSLSGFVSNFGLGMMFEHEVYEVGEGEKTIVTLNPFRVTSYLTLDWDISEMINAWGVVYYQPDIVKIHNFRSIVETGIEIWLIGKLFFTFDMSYRYNNEPVGDVKNYDITIKNGLRLSIP
ncbi:MAG: DUF481 domain-containing protein [Bacteroidales bacterium]|nr:DUF481 domain-containing protein [Bacteroidales bacterium]